MRSILILLAMCSTANAMTIGEVYRQQAAEILAENFLCPNKFRYTEYMNLLDKLAKEEKVDTVKAESLVKESTRDLIENKGFKAAC